MSAQEIPPPAQLMNLIAGKMVTQAVATAAELGIPDQLAAGPRTAAELATAIGAPEDTTYRLLRALSLVDVVRESDGRSFTLTPVGTFLRSDVPGSLGAMARWIGAGFHHELWAELTHCVKTGENAVKKVHNQTNPFVALREHPDVAALFNGAMTGFSSVIANAVVAGYDFSYAKRIADVGGGHGYTLSAILDANPAASGVLFDLPEVIAGAPAILGRLAARCEIVGGDFFKSVPAGCDAYVYKHILHDWSDDHCVTMLRHTVSAMAPGGRVVAVEHVVPPPGVPSFGKLLDLEMLVVTDGGRERTESDFAALFAKAGLKLARIVPLQAPVSVLEATRA